LSASRFAGRSYFLEGPEGREPLGSSYDDHTDVLYLWRGKKPVEAVSLPTEDGILVRVHPNTGELVGVTLLDYDVFWSQKERIEIDVPAVGRSESEAAARKPEHRQLVFA
jgi:Protein of unknown function (DUF2283)